MCSSDLGLPVAVSSMLPDDPLRKFLEDPTTQENIVNGASILPYLPAAAQKALFVSLPAAIQPQIVTGKAGKKQKVVPAVEFVRHALHNLTHPVEAWQRGEALLALGDVAFLGMMGRGLGQGVGAFRERWRLRPETHGLPIPLGAPPVSPVIGEIGPRAQAQLPGSIAAQGAAADLFEKARQLLHAGQGVEGQRAFFKAAALVPELRREPVGVVQEMFHGLCEQVRRERLPVPLPTYAKGRAGLPLQPEPAAAPGPMVTARAGPEPGSVTYRSSQGIETTYTLADRAQLIEGYVPEMVEFISGEGQLADAESVLDLLRSVFPDAKPQEVQVELTKAQMRGQITWLPNQGYVTTAEYARSQNMPKTAGPSATGVVRGTDAGQLAMIGEYGGTEKASSGLGRTPESAAEVARARKLV